MTTSVTTPTLSAGTWAADAVHSDVSFKVRHMAVGKAKGTFALKSATLVVGANGIADASVTAEIDAASVDTKQEQRDAHVRSADFLDVENHPTLTFVSKAAVEDGLAARLQTAKTLVAVENVRSGISKKDMVLNGATPHIEVDPETYDVRADGELLVCEPAEVLPMAQRYFLF